MIPDKVYLNKYMLNDMMCDSEQIPIDEPEYAKYIRKDALLEWAKETKEIVETDSGISEDFRSGASLELEEIIEHINKM